MKTSHAVLAMLAASVAAAVLMVGGHTGPNGGSAPHDPLSAPSGEAVSQAISAPWQIDAQPDGSLHVMGVRIGESTLGDAVQRYGKDTQVAVIAAPGEEGHLEAFVDPIQADFVMGKLVISAQATSAQLQGWRQRTVKAEFMESTTRRYMLTPEDRAEALKATVVGMSFIPQASLDEAAVISRFGQPAERLRSTAHTEHLLYPDKGVDVMLDTEGKELIQYVRPVDFEARLRSPLVKAAAALAASSVTSN
jgi:hypothetical protein